MERLELRLLGAPAVLEAGRRLALPSRKATILLARLATSRDFAVSRADAVSFLWPDVPSDKGRASLRQTLARLRHALGADAIQANAQIILLPTQRWWIDVHDLPTALGGPWTAGEFLAGEYFGEPRIDRWLDEQRRHWHEASLVQLCDQRDCLRGSDPERLVDACHAILALDPYDEGTHRDLMLALAALGHKGRAIKHYETLATLIESELGTAPQEETRSLARDLRHGRHAPARTPGPAMPPRHVDELQTMRLVTVVSVASGCLPAAAQTALRAVAERQHGVMLAGEPTRLLLGLEDAAEGDAVDALASILPYRGIAGIGCSCGLALIGEDVRTGISPPTGAVVAQADMLALLASRSEILVSDVLRRRLGKAVDASEIDVRGRKVWAFHGLTTARVRSSPPFVSRLAERSQIAGMVEDLRAGRGGTLVVTGAAGIGKTRLIDEALQTREARSIALAETGFQSFGDDATSFRVRLAGALQACLPAGIAVEDMPLHLRRTARVLLTPTGNTLRPESGEDERLVREVLVATIDQVTLDRPLVVRIEDTHWASEAQIAFLIALFEETAARPVLFIATERPLENKLASAVRDRSADQTGLVLALAPLGPQDAKALVGAALSGGRDVGRIVEKAQGNPLFLMHLSAAMRSDDALPLNLVALVQEQLDHRPQDVAAACHRAAILGHRFPTAAFAAIFPETPLAHLIRSGFATIGETDVTFTHALVQEAIYAMIPQKSRPALHRLAADVFRLQNPVLWAEHELLTGRDADAARACLAAVELLVSQRRLSSALRFANDGIACASDDNTMANLLFWRGNALRETASFDNALDDYEAASTLTSDANLSVQIALKRWAVEKYLGHLGAARDHLAVAARTAEGAELAAATRSELAQEQGDAAFQSGDGELCLRCNEAAHKIASEAGLVAAEARALGGIGDAHYARLDLKRAFDAFAACVSLAVEHELETIASAHRPMAAISRFYVEAGAAPLEDAAMAAEQARIAGSLRSEILSVIGLGVIQAFAADRDGVDATIKRLATLIGDAESRFRADYAIGCMFAAWLSGQAGETFAAAETYLARHDEPYLAPAIAGIAAVAAPEEALAGKAIDQGQRILERGIVAHSFLMFHHFAMRAAVRWRFRRRAFDLADSLAARIDLEDCTFARLAHAQTLAALEGTEADRRNVRGEIAAARLDLFLFEA